MLRLETRPASTGGSGAITRRDLVHNAVRMRPVRIIVGELRGSACFSMVQAMNTAPDGSMTTVHANAARDALGRIEEMVTLPGPNLPAKTIRAQNASAINVIVHLAPMSDAKRKVACVSEITGMENDIGALQDILVFRQSGQSQTGEVLGEMNGTGIRPLSFEAFQAAGIDTAGMLRNERGPPDDVQLPQHHARARRGHVSRRFRRRAAGVHRYPGNRWRTVARA